MAKTTYKPGDKVFAKVKGYPPWPAEVVSEAGKKYNVLFYGTKEVGAIKPEDMFFYLKHKDSYVHKYVKRAGYEDAVKQIEEAISKAGGDGNSTAGPQNEEPTLGSDVLETPTAKKVVKRKVTALPAPIDTTARKSKGRRRSVALSDHGDVSEEPASKKARRRSGLPSESENKSDLSETGSNLLDKSDQLSTVLTVLESADLSELKKEQDTAESVEDETTNTNLVPDVTIKGENESIIRSLEEGDQDQSEENNTTLTTVSATPKEDSEHKEEVPKKSPLKEVKKLSCQQLSTIKIVTELILNQYIKYAEHVRKHPDSFNGPVEPRTANENDVLPVKLPSGTMAGIKLHKKWPVQHETERERAFYDERLAKDALDAKKLLTEGSEVDLEVIPDIGKTADDIREITDNHVIEAKRSRLKRLKKEVEVLGWDVKMRDSLGLEKADPDAAFALLNEFITLKKHIDSLTLRKHPHIMDTIRRLRKYIGNVKEWIMTQEDQHIFMRKAEKIRNIAEEVYASLKEIIGIDEEKMSFWDGFMVQVTEFRSKCQDLSENEMLLLCSEPNTRKAFIDSLNEIPDTETALVVNAPEAAAVVR